jgi:hypothetical protein
MGFDDLARHMASRDKKALSKAASADQMVAEAARADRRQSRSRDLILGPLLLAGGLVAQVIVCLFLFDFYDSTPHPQRPSSEPESIRVPVIFLVGGFIAIGIGFKWTVRGLRGRSP